MNEPERTEKQPTDNEFITIITGDNSSIIILYNWRIYVATADTMCIKINMQEFSLHEFRGSQRSLSHDRW